MYVVYRSRYFDEVKVTKHGARHAFFVTRMRMCMYFCVYF